MLGVGKWCSSSNNTTSSFPKKVNPSKYSIFSLGWCDCNSGVPATVNIGDPAPGTDPVGKN